MFWLFNLYFTMFNIKKKNLRSPHRGHLCVFILWLKSEQKRLVPLKTLSDWYLQPRWMVSAARYDLGLM